VHRFVRLLLISILWANVAQATLLPVDSVLGPSTLTLDTTTGLRWLDQNLNTLLPTDPQAVIPGLRQATALDFYGLLQAVQKDAGYDNDCSFSSCTKPTAWEVIQLFVPDITTAFHSWRFASVDHVYAPDEHPEAWYVHFIVYAAHDIYLDSQLGNDPFRFYTVPGRMFPNMYSGTDRFPGTFFVTDTSPPQASIPEPTTLVTLGTGLIILSRLMRRYRSKGSH